MASARSQARSNMPRQDAEALAEEDEELSASSATSFRVGDFAAAASASLGRSSSARASAS